MNYSNTHCFNLDDYQLIGVDIKSYRMFKDQLIGLHPGYSLSKQDDDYVVETNSDPSDLANEYGLNLVVICGKNGVGKSTLLRILENKARDGDYNMIWKDADGNFMSQKRSSILYDGVRLETNKEMHLLDSVYHLCGNGAEQTYANTLKGLFVNQYVKNPKLYDYDDKPLFDHIYITYSDYEGDVHDRERFFARSIQQPQDAVDISSEISRNPALYLLSTIFEDSSFKPVIDSLVEDDHNSWDYIKTVFATEEFERISEKLGSYMYKYEQSDSFLSHRETTYFPMEEYSAVLSEFIELLKELENEFKSITEEWGVDISGDLFSEYFSVMPAKKHADDSMMEIFGLSDGEFRKLKYRFQLTPFLIQPSIFWFYFDQIEQDLHPEWCRRLVKDLLEAYRESRRRVEFSEEHESIKTRRLTCIITTHSPFIISDVNPENLVCLEKSKEGLTHVVPSPKRTFAGNIGELFHDAMFMQNTIGEFARDKIDQLLKKIAVPVPHESDVELAENLFSRVSDDILRSLLLERVSDAKDRTR